MKILGFREDCQASAWWRCWNWLDEFKRHGHIVSHIGMKYPLTEKEIDIDLLAPACEKSDVVLTSAKFFSPWIADELMGLHRKIGFTLVVDNDDPVWMLPAASQPAARNLISNADLVVVASDQMVVECEGKPRSIISIPNLANIDLFGDNATSDSPTATVVFAGGAGHVPDYNYLRPVIEKIASTRPDIDIVCVNACPDWAVSMGIAVEQKYDYMEHLKYLKSLVNAIAIVPLLSEYRTHLTTHTKYIDYTVCGIPGVYQGDHPAYDRVSNGVNGLRATSTDEWYSAIIRLADNTLLRMSIVANAKNDVISSLTTAEYADLYLDKISKSNQERRNAA